MFNIVYEVLLARKLRWYAMCPIVDAMNHDSTVQVGRAQQRHPHAWASRGGDTAWGITDLKTLKQLQS